MADVAVSEVTQSLVSIVAHDGPEDTGSDALVPSTKQTRKTRFRKVRPPDLKGRRGREEKKNVTMVNRNPQHKDYLSEQRSKRIEKQKSKGKRDGLIRSNKVTTDENETKDGEVEEPEEAVKDEDDSRGVSAGSNLSKDEGISSNGEKDEDLEIEDRDDGDKTDTRETGQEMEDDEGRGSINGDEEEAAATPALTSRSDLEATGTEEADSGAPDTEGSNADNTIEQEHLDLAEQGEDITTDMETVVEEQEEEAEYLRDAAIGYHGDMDEPNSLAASSHGSLTLSRDAGLGTTADLSLMRNELQDMTVAENDEPEAEEPDKEEEVKTEDTEDEIKEGEEETNVDLVNETEQTNEDEDNGVMLDVEEHGEDEARAGFDMEEDKADDGEDMEDNNDNDGEGGGEEEGAMENTVDDSAEKVTGEEAATGDVESESKEEANKEEEEEIKEIPAIAKIPGTYRRGRKNIAARTPRKQEVEVKKTPMSKKYDATKALTNRKPISWRPTPIQGASRPEGTQPRNNLSEARKFKARNLNPKSIEDLDKKNDVEQTEADNKDGDSQARQEDTLGESLELPPVNIPVSGDGDSAVVLDTFRSEGHNSQADSQIEDDSQPISKAESMPDIHYHDITRPNTAGKKGRGVRRKKGKPRKVSMSIKSSVPHKAGKGGSTSEVWVPQEDKLYVYTYSSQPRLLHVRRMAAGRVATTHQWDPDPNSSFRLKTRGNGNPMYDRRVVRGSNYAKRLGSGHQEEQGDQPTQHHQQSRRQEFREKLEARARLRRENHGVSSLYPSHASSHGHRNYPRTHVHVQTENYYEPLERPPEIEVEVQTEPWAEDGSIPPIVFQTPRGVDVDTQVYDKELDAGDEHGALVAALVSRTMRDAVLEVMQEEQAEQTRINKLATASLTSFVMPVEMDDTEQDNKNEDDSATEEREDPDGKETSPQDTNEPARSPEPEGDEPEVKEIHLISTLETTFSKDSITHDTVQESESLVI
ncbi:uncharacterized protein LOC121858359 isoform X2 [Homarus americanus]|uniref:uncharacterized protein LOC121858359 isoform X2 n=1 Tax=Homarus americanus TaxID=6706 RepID=UPI001C4688A9|nr:uncharacterized protein LOC121858359 isoform X2 [Homarus americanus]